MANFDERSYLRTGLQNILDKLETLKFGRAKMRIPDACRGYLEDLIVKVLPKSKELKREYSIEFELILENGQLFKLATVDFSQRPKRIITLTFSECSILVHDVYPNLPIKIRKWLINRRTVFPICKMTLLSYEIVSPMSDLFVRSLDITKCFRISLDPVDENEFILQGSRFTRVTFAGI